MYETCCQDTITCTDMQIYDDMETLEQRVVNGNEIQVA